MRVQFAIDDRRKNRYGRIGLLDRGHTFRRGHDAHQSQVARTGPGQHVERRHRASAGGQHRIDRDGQSAPTDAAIVAIVDSVQLDGKIVAAGMAVNAGAGMGSFALLRYTRHGDLDRKFGGSGMVTTDFGGVSAQANGLALQPDRKLVVVGSTRDINGNSDFALARYHPDGRLDASFGAGAEK